jgi:hypothetical protein
MAGLEFLGRVSTEGGPLLIADREALSSWSGVSGDGDDYQKACDPLNANPNLCGLQLELGGHAAIVWDMPTGTADVWRLSANSLVIVRPWVDEESRAAFLASLPRENPVRLGKLTLSSGWLVIMWAAEDGADIAGIAPRDGAPLHLSVDEAGLVAALPPGTYVCHHDELSDGSDSARRCWILADNSGSGEG